MPITLSDYTFDDANTTVREKHEEVGGRDARRIEIEGLVLGKTTVAAIEAELDAILDAASKEDFSAELSLRAGRRLWVRRDAFTREVSAAALVGSFELRLLAKDPFEESAQATSVVWSITASGATRAFSSGGNATTGPVITLVAAGEIVNPSFSDGVHLIGYSGIVADGATLVFDGALGEVRLDGDDVTPYSRGSFPEIAPDGTTLIYTDDAASSHTASVTVAFHDRWW
ncbi:MAG: hypothetical protein HY706_03195 [Candidatus Hydrogenedentes bacterium]|nr:hypothetical protein [Candidatus Hydrogenedentota bacterium]